MCCFRGASGCAFGWIALLVFALPGIPLVAVDPADAEIARLVKQLGHDEFEKREAATTRLKEIGEPARAVVSPQRQHRARLGRPVGHGTEADNRGERL